jgi:hypothetical protein
MLRDEGRVGRRRKRGITMKCGKSRLPFLLGFFVLGSSRKERVLEKQCLEKKERPRHKEDARSITTHLQYHMLYSSIATSNLQEEKNWNMGNLHTFGFPRIWDSK